VDRGWLGSQAFYSASAFNANIGAWNTASVTTLFYVCAAFGRQCATRRPRSVGLR
jgi:surface protein